MPSENTGVNQAKKLLVVANQIAAGLVLVASEIVAANLAGNTTLAAALTLEQSALTYQQGLLTATGVVSPLTGFQSDESTPVNPPYFPK
jgi:hypothetical protein